MAAGDAYSLSLRPRLVPQPLWGISGHRKLTSNKWEKIRKIVIAAAHMECELCGETREKGMIVDEVWSYTPGSAVLAYLQLVCPPCNAVIHVGNARSRGVADHVIVAHCAQVNGISEREAAQVIDDAFTAWHSLNVTQSWRVSVTPTVLECFPDSAILDRTTV